MTKGNILVKVTLTIEVTLDPDDLGDAYSNEDYLIEQVKEHIEYSIDRLDGEVSFIKYDIEGM